MFGWSKAHRVNLFRDIKVESEVSLEPAACWHQIDKDNHATMIYPGFDTLNHKRAMERKA
jgi:hypothetical protein